MKLEFESKAEIFVVENLTGRKVLDCDPVVLTYADLDALAGTGATEVVYFGTFEASGATDAEANMLFDSRASIKALVLFRGTDKGNYDYANNVFFTETVADKTGDDGAIRFYGFKMQLAPRAFGDELLENGIFDTQTPWTAGHPGDWDFTLGALHSTPGAGDSLSQEIPTHTTGDVYKIIVVVSGMTAGSLLSGIGDTSTTAISADGTYTQIIETTGDTDIFSLTCDGAFDGKIESVSLVRVMN